MRNGKRRRWPIPEDLLRSILVPMQRQLGKGVDNFITYDWEKVLEQCGPRYGHIPLDDIKHQGVNLRKRGLLNALGGVGPSKSPKLSQEYYNALARPEFRRYFDAICEAFGWRCAVCNTAERLEPHHRTYERLGREEAFDCIPVCRLCHKVADGRRRRQAEKEPVPTLF